MAETKVNNYGDESIVHLEGVEHIRRRPGMYIGLTTNERAYRKLAL